MSSTLTIQSYTNASYDIAMTFLYLHWDDKRTLHQLFDDRAAMRELVEAFFESYGRSVDVLNDTNAEMANIANEVHTLRSLFAIFNAHTAYEMAVEMDRHIRAGRPITLAERIDLVNELRAFAAELEHFLSTSLT